MRNNHLKTNSLLLKTSSSICRLYWCEAAGFLLYWLHCTSVLGCKFTLLEIFRCSQLNTAEEWRDSVEMDLTGLITLSLNWLMESLVGWGNSFLSLRQSDIFFFWTVRCWGRSVKCMVKCQQLPDSSLLIVHIFH